MTVNNTTNNIGSNKPYLFKPHCLPSPFEVNWLCDKTWDEPSRVTDRGAQGMALTKGRVMGEGCGGL